MRGEMSKLPGITKEGDDANGHTDGMEDYGLDDDKSTVAPATVHCRLRAHLQCLCPLMGNHKQEHYPKLLEKCHQPQHLKIREGSSAPRDDWYLCQVGLDDSIDIVYTDGFETDQEHISQGQEETKIEKLSAERTPQTQKRSNVDPPVRLVAFTTPGAGTSKALFASGRKKTPPPPARDRKVPMGGQARVCCT